MFELTIEEAESISRSQNVTLNDKKVERGSNIKYAPMVFTESGIYMLMTVLKGELAISQSKILIRTFKQMKDYIQTTQILSVPQEIFQISFQNEYPNVRLSFQKTGGKFHDRYIVMDYKTRSEKM